LFADTPDRTRLRSLVSKAFAARRVEEIRPEIAGIIPELFGGVADASSDGNRWI